MRLRLLVVVLPLLAVGLVALLLPLASGYATTLTREGFVARLADADRFAELGEDVQRGAVGRGRAAGELRRNEELFGVRSVVVDQSGTALLRSGDAVELADPRVADALRIALAGRAPTAPERIWPWDRRPLVVAVAASPGGIGDSAAVVVAPTADLRARVRDRLLLLAAAGLGLLVLVTAFGVLPLTRWVLRPIDGLRGAFARFAAGDLATRVPVRTGPPEVREAGAAFNRMAGGMERLVEGQRAFAADASHQLRNPLAALRLRMETLERHVAPEGRERLHAAIEETDRLSASAEMLLRLAQAEAEVPDRRRIDLASVVGERVAHWRPALEAAGSTLALEAAPAPAEVDPAVVEQVLDVLLDNAGRYGGGRVEVRCGPVGAAGEGARIVVRDHGGGLRPDELARAGERFWRAPRHQNLDGTGIGLSIARTLLRSAGGSLRLHDAAPGVLAEVRLPGPGALAAPPGGEDTAPHGRA